MITQSRYSDRYKLFLLMCVRALVNQALTLNFTALCFGIVKFIHILI